MHFSRAFCLMIIGGTAQHHARITDGMTYFDHVRVSLIMKSHNGHSIAPVKNIAVTRFAEIRRSFLTIFSMCSTGYVVTVSSMLTSFGFITGVEHNGHCFSDLSSSTPQFTQYDITITFHFFRVKFNQSGVLRVESGVVKNSALLSKYNICNLYLSKSQIRHLLHS